VAVADPFRLNEKNLVMEAVERVAAEDIELIAQVRAALL
jgi:hypothetical protein